MSLFRSAVLLLTTSFMVLLAACGGRGGSRSDSTLPIQVTVQPATAEVLTSGRIRLQVTVSGTTNPSVLFAVEESNGGGVAASGEYTAPTTPGTYHVVVTSAADATKTARVTITVRPYSKSFVISGGELPQARSHHESAVLADESIIFVGGSTNAVHRYRPDADRFDAVNTTLSTRRYTHTATSLTDGRVLVLGGETSPTASASVISDVPELYEPLIGPLSVLSARMIQGRRSQTATLLPNGNVFVAGGQVNVGTTAVATASTEIYNRLARTFSSGPSLPGVRFNHSATLLKDGRVLIAGGQNDCAEICERLASAVIYDPVSQTVTPTGSLNEARSGHSATLLFDGRVLIAGGLKPGVIPFFPDEVGTFEIYNPQTGAFTFVGNMRIARWSHTATLLNDGRVLIAGGSVNFPEPTARTEMFDPTNGVSVEGPAMSTARMFHTADLLPSGKVLITGGIPDGTEPLRSAELFQ